GGRAMKRLSGLTVSAVVATALCSALLAGAGATTGSAQAAARVAFVTADNDIVAVSCASAGTCTAARDFTQSGNPLFVIGETRGRWGAGTELPGSAALGRGQITALSCGSPGNCSVFGWYKDQSRRLQAFMDVERNGRWGMARQVPGTAALNTGGYAHVTSASCTSA